VKIVIFGLTISSSWGNGHATLWRGLCKNLIRSGHRVTFFERDVPYYAGARDLTEIPGGKLVLFSCWDDIAESARHELREADTAIVTSYCPDGISATRLVLDQDHAQRVFYDLDTPITLANLLAGESLSYIGPEGLRGFDLVLSFTGAPEVFAAFRTRLGAERLVPLYGHVDADVHRPAPPAPHYRSDLSYLGTYSDDRQAALEALFIAPARRRQDMRFLIGGAQYPNDFPWSSNIYFVQHVPPSEHPQFFASSRVTLNVTRRAMAETGWCPSGRLFEAAACGAPILSDSWPGIEEFFTPGTEIMLAQCANDTLAAFARDDAELSQMARRARERTLDQHSSWKRAKELIDLLEGNAGRRQTRPAEAMEA
jgi:spore maturation protein CgeB